MKYRKILSMTSCAAVAATFLANVLPAAAATELTVYTALDRHVTNSDCGASIPALIRSSQGPEPDQTLITNVSDGTL